MKKWESSNSQSRVASAVFDSLQHIAPHACLRFRVSEVPEAIYEARLRALEGRHVNSKNLQGSEAEKLNLFEGTEQ